MAEQILVNPELMLQTMNQYNTCKGNQTAAYTQLQAAVKSLAGAWEGDAYNAFTAKFNELYNNIKQSEERMQDAVTELQKSHDIFQQVESTISGEVNSLSAGSRFQG